MTYYITAGTGRRYSPTHNYEYITSVTTKIAIDIPLYENNTLSVLKEVTANTLYGFGRMIGGAINGNIGGVVNAGFTGLANDLSIEEGKSRLLGENTTAFSGLFLPMQPKVLVYKPRIIFHLNDTNYNHLYGVPCRKIDRLNTFGGFTKVGGIHIKEIPNATTEEVDEIESLLKQGVILDNTNAVFNITYNYNSSQVTLSNPQTSVMFGGNYTTSVNVVSGYQVDSIRVFMGGQEITSTAVSDNVINVIGVTANLSIRITSSVIPVYYTISYTNLTGATLSNTQTSILQGTPYSTTITPDYANGYYIGSYVPAVYMGGAQVTTGVEGNSISIPNVQGNITIGGLYPSVTTLVGTWSMRENFIDLPDEPIVFSNVHVAFHDGTDLYECTDCVIDDQTDLNGYFITFTTSLNQYIGITQTGAIYVDDVYTSQLASITFNESSEYYSSYSGLLEWLDTNFIKT